MTDDKRAAISQIANEYVQKITQIANDVQDSMCYIAQCILAILEAGQAIERLEQPQPSPDSHTISISVDADLAARAQATAQETVDAIFSPDRRPPSH